jgi:hypothetical protein
MRWISFRQGPSRMEIRWAYITGAWRSGDPLGLQSGGPVGLWGRSQWTGDPAEGWQVCGVGPSGVEIWQACRAGSWQAWGVADPAEQRSSRATELGSGGPDRWGPMEMELWLLGPWVWACQACCSFSKSWCGEDFHKLWVQSAEVSALAGAFPQPSVSQHLSKVPDSWSSRSLWLYPNRHIGSSTFSSFIIRLINEWCLYKLLIA